MKITRDTLLVEAFKLGNPDEMSAVLQGFGMQCVGCALAHRETIEQAAASHGADVDKMLEALNAVLNK